MRSRPVDFQIRSEPATYSTSMRPSRPSRPALRLIHGGTPTDGGAPPPTPPSDLPRPGHQLVLFLTKEHLRFLFGYLRQQGVRKEDLDDVVQETLSGTSRVLDVEEPRDFLSLLAGVARRQASNYRRRAHRRHEIPVETMDGLEDETPNLEDQAIAGSRRKVLRQLLAEISETRLHILIAREIEGMEFDEIAAELGMKETTVRNHHYLGMRALEKRKDRWQARQRWLGLDIVPALLAPLLAAKRAWAGGALRTALGTAVLVIGAAVALGIWAKRPEPLAASPAPPLALAPPAPRDEPTQAPTVTGPGPAVLSPASSSAPSSPLLTRGVPHDLARERKLMQQARTALAAGNDATARRLLEHHVRVFPRGQYAGQRQALLAQLRAAHQPP